MSFIQQLVRKNKRIVAVALLLVSTTGVTAYAYQNTIADFLSAQAASVGTGYSVCNYGGNCDIPLSVSGDVVFTPAPGLINTPTYRSSTDIEVKVNNLAVSTDSTVTDSEYKCKFEARATGATTYTTLLDGSNNNPDYIVATGCKANLPKSVRGTDYSMDIKVTVTKASDSSVVGILDTRYALKINGLL